MAVPGSVHHVPPAFRLKFLSELSKWAQTHLRRGVAALESLTRRKLPRAHARGHRQDANADSPMKCLESRTQQRPFLRVRQTLRALSASSRQSGTSRRAYLLLPSKAMPRSTSRHLGPHSAAPERCRYARCHRISAGKYCLLALWNIPAVPLSEVSYMNSVHARDR